MDVEGKDAVNKLGILLKHTFGIDALPSDILHKGITQISAADSTYAGEKGYDIKLVANAFRISDKEVVTYVLPQFIQASSQLKQVRNEYNGVLLSSTLADEQFLYGKGAGRYPTASAVLSDISALRYDYRYEYRKSASAKSYTLSHDYDLTVYVSYQDLSAVVQSDFSQIDETYVGSESGYLIGKISIQRLIHANWIDDKAVSVIELRTHKKEAVINRIRHEALVAELNECAITESVCHVRDSSEKPTRLAWLEVNSPTTLWMMLNLNGYAIRRGHAQIRNSEFVLSRSKNRTSLLCFRRNDLF